MNSARVLLVEQIPRLRRYARALLRDRAREEDLVQECLARALARLNLWRPGSDMRAWLFSIMHNLFVNGMREAARRPESPLTREDLDAPRDCRGPEQNPRLADLKSGLEALVPEQREVVLLVGLEGLSYQQAAEALDVPVGTVMSRLHRGRELLRRWMEGEDIRTRTMRRIK